MALVNHAKGEINAKIVYYGPGFSGKGTNLNYIYRKLRPEHRGQLKTMNVGKDRMLFFDFTHSGQGKVGDYNVRFHVYSIIGEVTGNTAWKMVLKGVDGIVFVVDSSAEKMKADIESLDELRKMMRGYGMSIKDLPGVLQCNKRDVDNLLPINEMEKELNYGGFTVMPAVAGKGEGVLESLFSLMKRVLGNLRENMQEPETEHAQLVEPIETPAEEMKEEPPVMEAAPEPVEAEPPQVFTAPLETVPETASPVALEPVSDAALGPVIEITGEAEQLSAGRLRVPIKIRCGDAVKEVPLMITVALELD